MGLDVYLRWDGITDEDKELQIQGYDITIGKYGYLRGAYNGHIGLEAIYSLFEGVIDFDSNEDLIITEDIIKILEDNLKELEKTLFKDKKDKFYKGSDGDEQQSYKDFVELVKIKFKQGLNPIIHFSG